MTDFEDYIEHEYASLVDAAGVDGIKRPDAVSQIAQRMRTADIEFPVDAFERLVASVVAARDNTERKAVSARLDWIEAGLNGDTILGSDDPAFDLVVSVGSGVRKTWRHLNADDWSALITSKAEHATASAVTSERFTKVGTQILRALARIGSDAVFGDLAS